MNRMMIGLEINFLLFSTAGDGFRAIRHGDAKVMVCGAAEAPINLLTMAAFCKIRAVATKFNETPERASRPFDAGRQGFLFAEGSAVLILEELEHALARGAEPLAEVLGFGCSGRFASVFIFLLSLGVIA